MKKFCLLGLAAVIFINSYSFAQVNVIGTILDSKRNKPLASATVVLNNIRTNAKLGEISNKNGEFIIEKISPDNYLLKISYVGYTTYEKYIKIGKEDINLGKLFLFQSEVITDEVQVTGDAPIGEQKNDTTNFNSKSFITQPDASTEDLIKKMPGIQVETDGTVKAQGEQVKKVLVDGKPFFGDDPSLALKNIPAEVVDKIQIFDKMSDQSEFTGFDDGNTSKAMNIVTKKNYRNGSFGKGNVGYGDQNKYTASANWNIFDKAQRFSILGLSNNINQQNFSMQDILDAMGSSSGGRGGGSMGGGRGMGRMTGGSSTPSQQFNPSDYFAGNQQGISKTNALGFNFSDNWFSQVDVSASYFINYTTNDNNQNLLRNYFLNSDSLHNYNQTNDKTSRNINHRFNMKLNWQIDSLNSLLIQPSVSVQAYESGNLMDGENYSLNSLPLNSSYNDYNANSSGLLFSNDLLYRHKFDTSGRTFSLNFSTNYNDKSAYSNQFTLNKYYTLQISNSDSLQLKSNAPVNSYGLTGKASYSEPLSKESMLLLSYSISKNYNNSDKQTFDFDFINTNYSLFDTLLSNKFNNEYLTNRASLGFQYKFDNINLQFSFDYQKVDLLNYQVFPYNYNNSYTFNNILPSMRFTYKISQRTNLMAFYRSGTNIPSVSQLQDVVDVSNPYQLTTGNTSLKQQFTNNFVTRYSNFSEDMKNVFMTFLNFGFRSDYIAHSTIYAKKDTIINKSVILPAGGQISMPVNMDGYWNANAMVTYGFPVSMISSNLNFNVGGSYTRIPSIVNNIENFSNAYNLSVILVVSSNVDENLDFTLSSRANFSTTRNSLQQSLNNDYNSYLNTANLKWVFWEGIFIQGEMRNQLYTGLVQANNDLYTILNFSIGKKLLNDKAELKLTLFDALNQNKSLQTNVTDSYIEYTQNNILQRYLLLTFTLNLKNFAGKGSESGTHDGFRPPGGFRPHDGFKPPDEN
jgi:hypothetical protein